MKNLSSRTLQARLSGSQARRFLIKIYYKGEILKCPSPSLLNFAALLPAFPLFRLDQESLSQSFSKHARKGQILVKCSQVFDGKLFGRTPGPGFLECHQKFQDFQDFFLLSSIQSAVSTQFVLKQWGLKISEFSGFFFN